MTASNKKAFESIKRGLLEAAEYAKQNKTASSKTRIMYIENKSKDLNGEARIGRVTFSKTGQSLTYRGRAFQRLKGGGSKANFFDIGNGEHYWISGPRKDGADRLYPQSTKPVEIDDDVADEYWRIIRREAGK